MPLFHRPIALALLCVAPGSASAADPDALPAARPGSSEIAAAAGGSETTRPAAKPAADPAALPAPPSGNGSAARPDARADARADAAPGADADASIPLDGADAGATHGALPAAPASACFDRELALSRYHYPDPTNIAVNWQDVYLLSLRDGIAERALRLTQGANDRAPYDNILQDWSPDGQRLLFVSSRGAGPNRSLYAMDPQDADYDGEGDNLRYLGQDAAELGGVHWPAGGLLFFEKGDGNSDIFHARIDPGATSVTDARQVTRDGRYALQPRLSGDGKWLLYTAENALGAAWPRYALHALRIADGSVSTLSPPDRLETDGTWLPGAGAVIFARAETPGGTLDLWRAALDPDAAPPALTGRTRITDTPLAQETAPEISADGACLAYLSGDLRVKHGPNADLWIRDMTTGEAARVTYTRDIAAAVWRP
ncbi:TolB family protein [Brevirhabdus sp.]|uniref:TolB family protein n=1 Tax=Brevirhabdus sp. TaxID=2004514 RepID=UPI0040589EC4